MRGVSFGSLNVSFAAQLSTNRTQFIATNLEPEFALLVESCMICSTYVGLA